MCVTYNLQGGLSCFWSQSNIEGVPQKGMLMKAMALSDEGGGPALLVGLDLGTEVIINGRL